MKLLCFYVVFKYFVQFTLYLIKKFINLQFKSIPLFKI